MASPHGERGQPWSSSARRIAASGPTRTWPDGARPGGRAGRRRARAGRSGRPVRAGRAGVDRLGARDHPGGRRDGSPGRAAHRRFPRAHIERQRRACSCSRRPTGRAAWPAWRRRPASSCSTRRREATAGGSCVARGAAVPERRETDPAALFYTSGTTGPPKGVPLTHGNLAFQINTLADIRLVATGDRVCLPLPLHHVYPFVVGLLTPLALGLPVVLPYALTGPQIIRALKEGEATVLVGVPRLYGALAVRHRGGAGQSRARARPEPSVSRSACPSGCVGGSAFAGGTRLFRALRARIGPQAPAADLGRRGSGARPSPGSSRAWAGTWRAGTG